MTNFSEYGRTDIRKSSSPNLVQQNGYPMAIVSGEDIYIIDPTGSVSKIKKSLANSFKMKKILAKCDFWGDLATF